MERRLLKLLLSILKWARNSGMFGTEGDGEENGYGLSVLWPFVLASIAIERVGIYIVSWSCGGPSQWKPIENSLSRHRLHRHYKNRIIRECTKRFWANFLLIREKKWTILKRYKDIQIVVYWYNMGFLFVYGILWFFMMSCQSLMVWYNNFLLASILNES